MDNPFSTEETDMKCSIIGCTGEYEQKSIVHTVRKNDEIFVFEHVPAEICSICGDTILKPDTIRKLEALLQKKTQPEKFIPLYEYA